MKVHVHHIDLDPGSTIAVGAGCTPEGLWVTFAGDHRIMLDLASILGEGIIVTEVPEWALLTAIIRPTPDEPTIEKESPIT